MIRKQRLTVTVDRDLIEAGNRAVAAGQADSLSGWVNRAMAERAARERWLQTLMEAVAAYEADFGEITTEEIAAQRRTDRDTATVVRGRKASAGDKAGRPSKGNA